eukprot:TRINITY_DN51656_c0_g1_i1.p1 TRINITY_DN51656_c0_g1~~TRINITY_DN51656_c0_g1_i1.p1  ORF type:complete len:568 (-),score=114.44 TRINITY_DN51656_c0_g1_i1:12-1604(-)
MSLLFGLRSCCHVLVVLAALLLRPAAAGSQDSSPAAQASTGESSSVQDLRGWIPHMKAKRAQGGSIEELAQDNRVVVVMTTIPPRMATLEPVVDAMLGQTWPVEAVHLSIPDRYNRTGETYELPDWLYQKAGLHIHRCEDLGPGTHLMNGLRIVREPFTFMVVVDDDHLYAPDLVETLMRSALAYPGSAVAAQGFLSVPGLKITKDDPRYLHDQGIASGPVLVSYLGVVYQRGFFDDEVFDYTTTSMQCRFQDDMWFSAHLARKGIKRLVLGAALGVQELPELHLGPSSLTFWKENKPRTINRDCNAGLLSKYPDVWALRRRLVLSVAGLPAAPRKGSGRALADHLRASEEWTMVFEVLRQLPREPDLVYLCTDTGSPDGAAVDGDDVFWFHGVRAVVTGSCPAYAPELPVGQALKQPLEQEADGDTVIVLAMLGDLVPESGATAILPTAACAADRHVASLAAVDETAAAAAGSVPVQLASEEATAGSTVDASRDTLKFGDDAAFCRHEGLVAVCLGSLASRFAGRTAPS